VWFLSIQNVFGINEKGRREKEGNHFIGTSKTSIWLPSLSFSPLQDCSLLGATPAWAIHCSYVSLTWHSRWLTFWLQTTFPGLSFTYPFNKPVSVHTLLIYCILKESSRLMCSLSWVSYLEMIEQPSSSFSSTNLHVSSCGRMENTRDIFHSLWL